VRRRILLLAGALALGAVAFSGDRFWLQFLGKAMIGCILAMSLDLLVGFTGLVSLAHSAFYGLAAYALAGVTNRLGLVDWTTPLGVAQPLHCARRRYNRPLREQCTAGGLAASSA